MIRKSTNGRTRRTAVVLLSIGAAVVAVGGAPAVANARPAARVSHTALQAPPIQLGTSGGWARDLANGYCCGGTLGALVLSRGVPHILSNWHVFAMDTVDGGNGIVAADDSRIIQPGLIDVDCSLDRAQVVGSLVPGGPSPKTANVDAALAEVVSGAVSADGSILEIGPPANTTVGAFVGQAVKKSGRTSRLTRSTVSGLNATLDVSYETECAGSPAFTKRYTGQILVTNRGSKFLKGGDSGSLMVEDVEKHPRAVGLLFAGSNLVGVANPIDEVLGVLGATMVGGTASATGAAESEVDARLQAAVGRAIAAQARNARLLERVPESTGHAVGLDRAGRVVIKVLVQSDSPRARAAAPRSLDGVPVVVEAVGRIVAY